MNLQIAGEERKCKIDFSSMTVFTSDLPNFQIVRLLKTESSADDGQYAVYNTQQFFTVLEVFSLA